MKTIPTLRVNALRVGYMRAEFKRYPIEAVAVALNDLSGRAEQADPIAREALAAVIPLLSDESVADHVEALRRSAQQAALLPLARLLRTKRSAYEANSPLSGGPTSSPGPSSGPTSSPPAVDPRLVGAGGKAPSLGERKSMARRPSRQVLEKMMKDPHPLVIRNLLANPKLTEDDVVALVARRPGNGEAIMEIARHPSWSQRSRVRMAIIQNPGTPTELSVPLVRLLIRPELLQVIGAVDVPSLVRAAASELLERRPPVPERGDRGLPQ